MALTYTPENELGKPCPDFSLLATDGKNYSLKDFSNGKPLLVMFICNHCPYVKAIESRLMTLSKDLKALGINTVAISSNDPKKYEEDSFENMKKKNYPFVYLYDESQIVAKTFGAVCTPDFFVYDGKLSLKYRGRLDDSWKDESKVTKRELYDAMKLLAESKDLTEKQTPSMGCSIKWKEHS